jgi:hypothetical protein
MHFREALPARPQGVRAFFEPPPHVGVYRAPTPASDPALLAFYKQPQTHVLPLVIVSQRWYDCG